VITAFVSADGEGWTAAGEMFTPFPRAVHAGVVGTVNAVFAAVRVTA
jgi:hypothetical protein